MRAIRKYATESAYNTDVENDNILPNQVSKTMDTGEVHYIINDYSHTFTFDSETPIRSDLFGEIVTLMFNSTQIGELNELQFNILKNGGREFYLKDVQDLTTYHIEEVKYSSNALVRFGWETYEFEELDGLANVIKDSCGGAAVGGAAVGNYFLFMKDVIELKVDTKGDMFILRNSSNELLLVFKSLDDFSSRVEYIYNHPVGVDA